MAKKKKETKLSDIITNTVATNENVTKFLNDVSFVDEVNYLHVYHPVLKNRKIFLKITDAYILTNNIIKINSLIKKYGILNSEILDTVNSIILLLNLIDSYNGITHLYEWKLKQGDLYIS